MAGLDERTAIAVYAPLARQALANAERWASTQALTGPFLRGDAGTIADHLDFLKRAAPERAAAVRRGGSARAGHNAPAGDPGRRATGQVGAPAGRRAGDRNDVASPLQSAAERLTSRQMLSTHAALRAGRPHTRFVQAPLPDGDRALRPCRGAPDSPRRRVFLGRTRSPSCAPPPAPDPPGRPQGADNSRQFAASTQVTWTRRTVDSLRAARDRAAPRRGAAERRPRTAEPADRQARDIVRRRRRQALDDGPEICLGRRHRRTVTASPGRCPRGRPTAPRPSSRPRCARYRGDRPGGAHPRAGRRDRLLLHPATASASTRPSISS